jgi:MoxR-like ATPase
MSKAKSQEQARGQVGLPLGPIVKEVLRLAYRARRPVLLEGPTGIGKSEIVAELAAELGIGYLILDLSLLEPPDLVGLPVIENGRTSYAVPQVLPVDGAGILMLEELNRAERYIQQPALQLLTARRLHEYQLPDDWMACAAINPEKGDYQVTPLDPALRSRFLSLVVRADRDSWLLWAEANATHPAVLDLARHHDHFLDDVPPRTWTFVSHLLQKAEPAELRNDRLMHAALGGYLPAAWIEVLLQALEQCQPEDGFDVRQMLASYDRDADMQQKVAALHSNGSTDILEKIAYRLHDIVDSPRLNQMITAREFRIDAFERLVLDLPGDAREEIQNRLGENLAVLPLLNVTTDDLVRRYAGSRIADQVRLWAKDPARSHRIALLVRALLKQLQEKCDVPALRKDRGAMTSLGQFLADVSPRWAPPLEEAFQRLSLQPIVPGKR